MSWTWLTPFGNALWLLPLAILVAAFAMWHERMRHWREVLPWLGALLFASALVAASKIAFYGWGVGVYSLNLTAPSGHAVLAMAFWPVFLMLLAPTRRVTLRTLLAFLGVALGLAVGVSRTVLGAHPPSEVLAGVMIGGVVAAIGVGHMRRLGMGVAPVVLLLAALVALPSWKPDWIYQHLPSERWFARIATELSGRDKPYNRTGWLREGRAAAAKAQPRP